MVSRTINVALAALTIGAAGTAGAQQTTYDYSGAPMSGTEFGSFIGPNGDAATYSYCCTTLDGSMTLAAPLAANLNNAIVDPTALTFGFTSIGGAMGAPPGANPGPPYSRGPTGGAVLTPYADEFGGSYALPGLIGGISVSTNGAGQIIRWSLEAGTPAPTAPENWNFASTSSGDSLTANNGTHGPDYTLSSSTAGSWSAVRTSAVPEFDAYGAGAALTLLAGLIALLTGRRRAVAA